MERVHFLVRASEDGNQRGAYRCREGCQSTKRTLLLAGTDED